MLPRMRATCASPSSWVSLPLVTSLAAAPSVTSRALLRPVSTKRWSTSLRITGMSAAAITWAISPPITPAPTTAALKTNMPRRLAAELLLQLHIAAPLAGEPGEAALQRRGDLAADEEPVDDRRRRGALLQLVGELERDEHVVGRRPELD